MIEKFTINTTKLHTLVQKKQKASWREFGNLELLDKNIGNNLLDILWTNNSIELLIDHEKESITMNWFSIDDKVQSMPIDIHESQNQKAYRHIISAIQQSINMEVFEDIFQQD